MCVAGPVFCNARAVRCSKALQSWAARPLSERFLEPPKLSLQQPSLRRRLFLGAALAGVAVAPRMPSVCGTPPGATPAATPGFSPSPLLFQLSQTARQQPGRFRASLDCQSAHRRGPGGTRRSLPASLDASTSGHAAPPARFCSPSPAPATHLSCDVGSPHSARPA